MKTWVKALSLILLLALIGVFFVLRSAAQVAVGYSAKQLCSGVFVAGLPATFIEQQDITPRMSILGPALSALQFEVIPAEGTASSRLFGIQATATHRAGLGCTLHAQGDGVPPMTLPDLEAASPSDAKLDALADSAFTELADGGRNTLALLASVAGNMVVERYLPPVTQQTRMQSWSMNKSLMATWIGLQVERGGLDPTAALAKNAKGEALLEGIDPRLTLLHLLQMESGLDFEEVYGPGSDVTRMLYAEPAMWTVPASAGQAHTPGTHFAYSSGDTVLASYVWQRSLNEPFNDWIDQTFNQALGLHSLVAETDASGVQVGSSYAHMTARDWLRVGQLWLDAWHGRSDLLSQSWLRASVAPRPSDSLGRYGRGFWLNTNGIAFEGVPENAFYAGGNAGQFVVVVPEWELVAVRLGLSDSGVDTGVAQFLREVEDSVPGLVERADD